MMLSTTSRHPSPVEATPPLRWSRRDWAALILLALLAILFYWRILTPNLADRASFPPGDFSHQFWAFSTFEARELSAGRLPLWNPFTYAGAPFWADIQSAVFYPPSLLTLLLSGPWGFSLFALELEAILHFWLAAIFSYLFVRRLTHHRGGALFAAITFTFGGYLTGYPSQQLAVLETNTWLPLLLYFADRALIDRAAGTPQLRPNLPNTLAAGLVWGIALLAGHPQSAMFVFYAFTLYVMFLVLGGERYSGNQSLPQRPAPSVKRTAFTIPLFTIVIGLGLSAIAWLPGLEYMRLSVRAAGLYDKMSGGFPLYDAIQVLLPGSLSFYSPLYVGVLPLLLAVWAALALRRPQTIFWGALAAGAFLLSFGGETFLYTPFYLLAPGFSIFRDQERAAFIVSFALAVLAGYGFKYQTSPAYHPGQTNLNSAVRWLLLGAVGLVVLFFYALNHAGWQDDSPFNLLLSRSIWLTILLILTWGATKIRDRRSEAERLGTNTGGTQQRTTPNSSTTGNLRTTRYSLAAACFLLITMLDLFTANWKTNVFPSLPEAQTALPGVVRTIQQDAVPDEIFRVYNEYRIYENYGVPYEMEDAWGASPLRLARYDDLYRSLRMERIWELLNVKYVITWRQELYAPSEIIYQEPAGDEVTYVHRLEQVAPRAWLVYQAQQVDEDATLAELDAFGFDPAQMALIPPGTSISLDIPPSNQKGQVEILYRTPGSLLLNVSTLTDGLLVISEIYYPGWRAVIDDQASPLLRVDHTLRGILVRAGQHRVHVSYQPAAFLWGALISGITLGGWMALGLWAWLRQRRGVLERGPGQLQPPT
jgi:hypothetical protein